MIDVFAKLSRICPRRVEETTKKWLAALDDFRTWLIREAA